MLRYLPLLLLFLTACETETDWTPEDSDGNALVVEALFTNEYKHQVIHLSKPTNKLNSNNLPISDAIITLSAAGHQVNFLESEENRGTYISEQKFATVVGVDFHLKITANGKIYKARTRMIPVKPATGIKYAPTVFPDSIKIVPPNNFDLNEQAMHEYTVDWSHLSANNKTSAKLFYYTFNSIDVSQITPPDKKEVFFPKGSIITYRKYSLTPAYADFLHALVAESQWQGGIFSENSENLPTNISNDGLGFFAASAVVEVVDTAFLQ